MDGGGIFIWLRDDRDAEHGWRGHGGEGALPDWDAAKPGEKSSVSAITTSKFSCFKTLQNGLML